jgi:two-component system heavy metal sensor histidine kinase CusS
VSVTAKMSLTVRLTLLFSLASTTVLLLLGYMIANSVEKHFEQQDMEILTGKIELAGHALEKVRTQAELEALPQQLSASLIGHHGLTMMVISPVKGILFLTPGAQFPDALKTGRSEGPAGATVWRSADTHPRRGISRQALTGIPGAAPAVIAVSTDIDEHEQFMHSFKTTLWLVVLSASVLTGFFGWIAARRGLAPLYAMRREVEGITARRLDARLSAASVPTELAELAETLNMMLARLEESFLRLSNYSSDLAHELRTPVSNLLTQTQVTLSKTRTSGEYADILASNAEEFERLSRIISDMLFLAKSDNDLVIPSREPFSLTDEVHSVIEFYEALSDEKNISLTVSGWGMVSGDRLMVRRALNNLLSNAIRHTEWGGRITVSIQSTDGTVDLSVSNTGETIAPDHLPSLFDRFYRVDASRQRQSDGAGLGLAITRSIMRAHGGDAAVNSHEGVTTFWLRFGSG